MADFVAAAAAVVVVSRRPLSLSIEPLNSFVVVSHLQTIRLEIKYFPRKVGGCHLHETLLFH